MNIALPEGIVLPNSAQFGKQYLNFGNVYKPGESELFFLALKAKELVGDDLLRAREELGLDDVGREQLLQLDFVRTGNYNYFFYEHDVKKSATVTANLGSTIAAGSQVSGGSPINFNLILEDNERDNIETGYVILNDTTREMYYVVDGNSSTANHSIDVRWIPSGTYSSVTNFPPTFTNRTTASAITDGDVFIILGSIVQHGATSAIEYKPLNVNVRQGRVQTAYEKFGKTLQALMAEGSNLTRTTDYNERMGQFIYDFLERRERSCMYSRGDYQSINGGNFYFQDGVWDQIGTTVAANTLDGTPTVPTYDAFDDIIERISQTGSNYALCVGRKMRRYVSKMLRSTTSGYSSLRTMKEEAERTLGNKLFEVIGTHGNVPIVYCPPMNHSATLRKSVMALNIDNIIPTTVSNQASVELNGLGIEGDGILKMKKNLQTNEELNKYDGVICDMGISLAHQTSHYLFENFSGVS